jgi:hypothetical protein
MKEGKDKIDKYLAAKPKHINGWKLSSWLGDRAFHNGDWLLCAVGAKASTLRCACDGQRLSRFPSCSRAKGTNSRLGFGAARSRSAEPRHSGSVADINAGASCQ